VFKDGDLYSGKRRKISQEVGYKFIDFKDGEECE